MGQNWFLSLITSLSLLSQLLFPVAKGLSTFPLWVIGLLYLLSCLFYGFCKTLIKLARLESLEIWKILNTLFAGPLKKQWTKPSFHSITSNVCDNLLVKKNILQKIKSVHSTILLIVPSLFLWFYICDQTKTRSFLFSIIRSNHKNLGNIQWMVSMRLNHMILLISNYFWYTSNFIWFNLIWKLDETPAFLI